MSYVIRHRVLQIICGLRRFHFDNARRAKSCVFQRSLHCPERSVSCTEILNVCRTHFHRRRTPMRLRHTFAYVLMAGAILLFAGGAAQAEQKSGAKSGTQSGSGTMKQGHESSGKMGQDSPITESDPGGIVTRGGRGEVPSSSKVDPLSTDQRDDATKSGPGGVTGNKGSSGNRGSSGGTGSSGSSGGASGGGGGY